MNISRDGWTMGSGTLRRQMRVAFRFAGLAAVFLAGASGLAAQQGSERNIELPDGNSRVVRHVSDLATVVVGDPTILDVVALNSREVVIHAKEPGSTTLLLAGQTGTYASYTVRVTADAVSLQRELELLFPGENLSVEAMGTMVILSGETTDPQVAKKAVELVAGLGEAIQVMDNIAVDDPGQILLQVRFAEVSRNAMEELGVNITRVDPRNIRGANEAGLSASGSMGGAFLDGTGPETTFSDAVNFFLFHDASNVGIFIQALKENGMFRSLAEPNLLAMPAESASFLAGGEFPYPIVQGGANAGAITIQFKEFGIRLNFYPEFTNSGGIRLEVAPEVSALDFTNGLTLQGFSIPALLMRRAETTIELRDGQTFAIAGLLDNRLIESVSKVPLLGDIPILGALFRSKEMRQNRSELLVLVTPRIVRPTDEVVEVPTGEPEDWDWDESLKDPVESEDGGGEDGDDGDGS